MEIEVAVEPTPESRDALSRTARRAAGAVVDVSAQALSATLSAFLDEVGTILSAAPESVGPYEVDQVEIAIGVTHSGSLRIVSSSADASMTIVLRRSRDAAHRS